MTDDALETRRSFPIASLIPVLILCAVLLPWILVQWNRSVNGNVAWLSICAHRWLETEDAGLSQICYDSNPPLSILLYVPPVYLSGITGIEDYYVIYGFVLVLVAFSGIMTIAYLSRLNFLSSEEKAIISSAYLLSTTIMSSISFGDRDHLIAALLFPYVLAQLCLTWRYETPSFLKGAALTLGSLAIIIKPHFAILPAILLLHRLYRQKRWQAIFDVDMLLLATFVIIYTTVLVFWFQDFLSIILPDSIRYYLPNQDAYKTYMDLRNFGVWIAFTLALLVFGRERQTQKAEFLFLLISSSVVSLFVYVLQMKGLDYQLFPVLVFLFPASALGLHITIKKYAAAINENLISIIMILACISYTYYRTPLRPHYPTHKDYQNAELTKFIKENCGTPCSYMVTHENMEITSQTAFYLKGDYATRFPVFWFIPLLERTRNDGENNAYPSQSYNDLVRFSEYVAQDIATSKPSLIMVLSTQPEGTTQKAFDYFSYFSQSQAFTTEAQKYVKTGTFSTDRGFYFRDTRHGYEYILTWDVYKPISKTGK